VAAKGGHIAIIRLLLENGDSTFIKDKDGRTALDIARTFEHRRGQTIETFSAGLVSTQMTLGYDGNFLLPIVLVLMKHSILDDYYISAVGGSCEIILLEAYFSATSTSVRIGQVFLARMPLMSTRSLDQPLELP
jgi:hypothetical protein